MDSKLILLYFLIGLIAVIYASPTSLKEEHFLSRSKRDTCKYLFGWCGDGNKCCKHLYCGGFSICWWDGHVGRISPFGK
uniref:LolToxJ n=1 Tax=Bichromomyia olmeca TaxID=715919 RepID=A0A1B1V3H2_9DIPT|nr:LolToxJ [Bichromomyia olmeca]